MGLNSIDAAANGGGADEAEEEREEEGRGPPPKLRRTKESGTMADTYTLKNGGALVLEWPEVIPKAEADDIAMWLQIMTRKVQRSIESGADDGDAASN